MTGNTLQNSRNNSAEEINCHTQRLSIMKVLCRMSDMREFDDKLTKVVFSSKFNEPLRNISRQAIQNFTR